MNSIQKTLDLSYTPFQPVLTTQGMNYFGLSVNLCPPTPALSSAILAFLQVDIDKPTPYPVVPDGTNMMFFSSQHGLVSGTRLSILETQLMQPGEYFGVWFKPGTLRQFFDVDLTEITQSVVGDDFLESRNFMYLNERLYEKKRFSERVALCESLFLKAVLQKSSSRKSEARQSESKLSHAFALIYQNIGSISVTTLADKVGLSNRQLNRLFTLHTGLSPKAFSQLIRTQAFLKRCYRENISALSCGLDLGFYDQPHMIKSLNKHGVASLTLQTQQFMSDFYKPQQKGNSILFSK